MASALSNALPNRETDSPVRTRPGSVEANLNYLAASSEKPVSYTFTPPEGTPQTTRRNDRKTVTIRNARLIDEELSLDEHGFILVHHQSSVRDFYNDDEVRRIYYPEVEALLKHRTGALKVVIFDHLVRNAEMAKRRENNAREYGKAVHNDYTLKSAPRRVTDHVPDEAEELLKHRVAEINVWRAIRGPIQAAPLAICDARSIDPRDAVPCDLVYPHRVGETYAFNYNPEHRWFYFPEMQPYEALLLKCYDSLDDGRARFTAHSAFDDPSSAADAPPRESIEVRALLFFAPTESTTKNDSVQNPSKDETPS